MKKQQGKPPGLLQPVADPIRPWEEIDMDFYHGTPREQQEHGDMDGDQSLFKADLLHRVSRPAFGP